MQHFDQPEVVRSITVRADNKLNSDGAAQKHAVTAILRGIGRVSNSFVPNVRNGKEIYKGLES